MFVGRRAESWHGSLGVTSMGARQANLEDPYCEQGISRTLR